MTIRTPATITSTKEKPFWFDDDRRPVEPLSTRSYIAVLKKLYGPGVGVIWTQIFKSTLAAFATGAATVGALNVGGVAPPPSKLTVPVEVTNTMFASSLLGLAHEILHT